MRFETVRDCKKALQSLVMKVPFDALRKELDGYTIMGHAHTPYSTETAKVLPRPIKTHKDLYQCQKLMIICQGYMDRILAVKNEAREFLVGVSTIRLAVLRVLYDQGEITDKTAKHTREAVVGFKLPQLEKYEGKGKALYDRCDDLNWNLKSTMGALARLREFAEMSGIQLVKTNGR